jgi:hypothetical protein
MKLCGTGGRAVISGPVSYVQRPQTCIPQPAKHPIVKFDGLVVIDHGKLDVVHPRHLISLSPSALQSWPDQCVY